LPVVENFLERLRARRAARPRVVTDDERSESPGLYVLVGLASLALVALSLTFLVVPPALAAHLFIRAQRSGEPLLRWAGVALMGVWFVLLLLIGRRVMSRPTQEE
jgi:hypothetical protein